MNVSRACLSATLLVAAFITSHAQLPVKAESFPLGEVRITSGMFKHAERMDMRYLLALDADRLLAPYRKQAGLCAKAENYTNWENTGLDGHIGGHYLSALACMYAATGDAEIKRRMDYVVDELKTCQQAAGDGYLCGVPDGRRIWQEVGRGDIRASGFGLNGGWVPLYNIHKTFAGLRDAYVMGGSREAMELLVGLAQWLDKLVSGLDDRQLQDMLRSEHGGLNEVLADVASLTGDERYLALARRFSHRAILQPLLEGEDRLTGLHANTQIPKVIGYKRVADVEGNADWDAAARFFWETVVRKRSITIGGNSVREHFHPSDDFSPMLTSEQGPETCNTYNMLRLTKLLYQTSADAALMDYYERALFNHILSSQDPVQGGFVYFTPMRAGHYRVYSQPHTSFWCCVGSGMENHARYGEMIYSHTGESLLVNLFIPSTLRWGDVEVEQRTSFPYEAATTLVLSPKEGQKEFAVKFRLPEWTQADEVRLSVNGQPASATIEDGYIGIRRTWQKADSIRVEMPMRLRAIGLPDGSNYYSFLYGPIVLASRMGTQEQDGIFADDSRGGHIANGPRWPLQYMPALVGDKGEVLSHVSKAEGGPLTFTLHGVQPERYEGMVLEPFYRIHECRYMVYWPVYSADEWEENRAQLAKEEQARAELDAITLDKVTCGEQQPESDHFVRMEQSEAGNDEGTHWRSASGWFSYQLQTKGRRPARIRLALRPEQKRDAKVWINGMEAGTIADGGEVQTVEVPASLRSKDTLEVRIARGSQTRTPHIYEVRLLSE